jgi:signal transduction histidine kinase
MSTESIVEDGVSGEPQEGLLAALLQDLPEAVLTVDAGLRIAGPCSRQAMDLFSRNGADGLEGQSLLDILMPRAEQAEQRRQLQDWLELVFSRSDLGWGSLAPLNPAEKVELQAGGPTLHLHFAPVREDGSISRLLVIGRDEADLKALEEALRQQEAERAETFSVVTQILRLDAQVFRSFLSECRALVSESKARVAGMPFSPDPREALDTLFRKFHTIKGNARTLELAWIEQTAHACEDALASLREHDGKIDRKLCKPLNQQIKALSDVVKRYEKLAEQVLGPDRDHGETRGESRDLKVPVQVSRLDAIRTLINGGVGLASRRPMDEKIADKLLQILRNAMEAVDDIRHEPVRRLLRRFPKMVQDLASSLEKEVDDVNLKGGDFLVDVRLLDRIADALVHVVRNAIYHGIEPPEEREELGKPRAGRIEIEVREHRQQLIIEVKDDGRGLDVGSIAEKALKLGLIDERKARALDLNETFDLLTSPGFSTAEGVDKISGRGVGLDVVRRAMESLHGRFSLDSQPGQGCVARLWLPLGPRGANGQT